jgi:hypothetical protein
MYNKKFFLQALNDLGKKEPEAKKKDSDLDKPQMKKGGSKKFSSNLQATNRLFAKNPLLKKKNYKKKIYDPTSMYFDNGGEKDGMTGMMKARLAYANEFGNPAAKRMINLPDNPYQFENGNTGTHYMASIDNYAVPQIQDENGQLMLGDYGPESNEAMRFDSDEDAAYFAEHYKDVSPGFIEAELTKDQIRKYVEGGYIVEEIDDPSIPSLNRFIDGGSKDKKSKKLRRNKNEKPVTQNESIEILNPSEEPFDLPKTETGELYYEPITTKDLTDQEIDDIYAYNEEQDKLIKEQERLQAIETAKVNEPKYYQEGLEFVEGWHNSPMYNQMVLNSFRGNQKNADYLTSVRKKNLADLPGLNIQEKDTESDTTGGSGTAGWSFNSTGLVEVFPGGYEYGPSLYVHELTHSGDRPRELYKSSHPAYNTGVQLSNASPELINMAAGTQGSWNVNSDGTIQNYPDWMLYKDPRFPQDSQVWHDRVIPSSDSMYITTHRGSNWKDNEDYKIAQKEGRYLPKGEEHWKNQMIEWGDNPEDPEFNTKLKEWVDWDTELAKNRKKKAPESWKSFAHDYVSSPHEVRARLAEIRHSAKKEGVYDPFTEQITPEIFQNYINKERDSENWQPMKPIEELRRDFNDEEILWMLQNISKNKPQQEGDENIPQYSKVGGAISTLNKFVGGGTISEQWENITGTPWSQAKKKGLTDGSYTKNIELHKRLLAGEFGEPKTSVAKDENDDKRYNKMVGDLVDKGYSLDQLVRERIGTREGLIYRFPELFANKKSQSKPSQPTKRLSAKYAAGPEKPSSSSNLMTGAIWNTKTYERPKPQKTTPKKETPKKQKPKETTFGLKNPITGELMSFDPKAYNVAAPVVQTSNAPKANKSDLNPMLVNMMKGNIYEQSNIPAPSITRKPSSQPISNNAASTFAQGQNIKKVQAQNRMNSSGNLNLPIVEPKSNVRLKDWKDTDLGQSLNYFTKGSDNPPVYNLVNPESLNENPYKNIQGQGVNDKDVLNRQLNDYTRYRLFPERGQDIMNRTDVKRNRDSELFFADHAGANSVIIDIGSGLGNSNPALAGVSTYELASNPNIKKKNIKVIATDIPSEIKTFKKHGKSALPLDVESIPMSFDYDIANMLNKRKLGDVNTVYLRSANSIDLLMSPAEMQTHFKKVSQNLYDKEVFYVFNNAILKKPPYNTEWFKIGNINNAAYNHQTPEWEENPDRDPYELLSDYKKGGVVNYELGDQVDEATKNYLESLGYTFEEI